MEQYIKKSALVAEIEKMLQEEYPCDNSEQTTGYHCALYELQDFLDTLEVREVELTWEDMRELYIIFAEVDTEIELCMNNIKAETLGYYQEVLKRFKERRRQWY